MPADMQLLVNKLQEMKDVYEEAIRNGKYTSLIRSKRLINLLHEYVIEELKKRVEPSWVVTDKKVYGFPKKKEQDILVQPPQNGTNVSVGPIMAINVRSQLSSIDKNYDTLFERIFAESLNLHNRFPYMALGYLYLLPKVGYDSDAAKENRVVLSERYNLEKYVLSFSSIANRTNPSDVPWKYEKVCLLIVDFESEPPKVMDNLQVLLAEGMISEKFAQLYTFDDLTMKDFFDELYKLMMERHYLLGFR
ncbi:MAG TPA: hypothetical protein HA348_05395 [Thermoplasmata archaeon]|nr:hypothetical protein [Thermoplasmata archaeon]